MSDFNTLALNTLREEVLRLHPQMPVSVSERNGEIVIVIGAYSDASRMPEFLRHDDATGWAKRLAVSVYHARRDWAGYF